MFSFTCQLCSSSSFVILQFSVFFGVGNGKLYDIGNWMDTQNLNKNWWNHIVLMAAQPVSEPSQIGIWRWKIKPIHRFSASLHNSCGWSGGLELAQRCPRKRANPKFKMFDTLFMYFFHWCSPDVFCCLSFCALFHFSFWVSDQFI
jgi:hypothetical protein